MSPPDPVPHSPFPRPSWVMRLWLAVPERVFALLGVLFLGTLVVRRLPAYAAFPRMGPYYEFADGRILYLPFIHILIDATSILVMLGFILRQPPRERNARGRDVALALGGAFLPFLPFFAGFLCQLSDTWAGTHWLAPYRHVFWSTSLSFARTFLGVALVTVGNAGDIWGYGVLLRSFSIVPEARTLRVTGPYRIMRHPVYFCQILAQAGVFLCFAVPNGFWAAFWVLFATLQMLRARREEQVLEAAFGEPYLAWRRRTFWFW